MIEKRLLTSNLISYIWEVFELERYVSNLKDIRLDRGLTILELSESTGVATRTIMLMESDSGSNPQIATVKRLLDYLEISFEELYPRK